MTIMLMTVKMLLKLIEILVPLATKAITMIQVTMAIKSGKLLNHVTLIGPMVLRVAFRIALFSMASKDPLKALAMDAAPEKSKR